MQICCLYLVNFVVFDSIAGLVWCIRLFYAGMAGDDGKGCLGLFVVKRLDRDSAEAVALELHSYSGNFRFHFFAKVRRSSTGNLSEGFGIK